MDHLPVVINRKYKKGGAMKIEKFPVIAGRTRRIPQGFGWIDHRVVQDGYLRECSTDSAALYLVLVTVADQDGLSYYGESLLCAMLGWSRIRLEKARKNLEEADLIAWSDPIYQVLEVAEKGGIKHDYS
jgi:hypothetical protein